MFFKERAVAYEKISMCDYFWKKMCSWYFLFLSKCVAAPKCISMFFKERAAASKEIFWSEEQIKIKTVETYSLQPITFIFGWIIVMKIIILKEYPLPYKT